MVAKLTQAEIDRRITSLKKRNIELICAYTKSMHAHQFRCVIDGHIWVAPFDRVYRGSGCAQCSGGHLPQTEISKRIAFLKERNIELISPFTKIKDTHTFRCLLDGYEWKTSFNDVYRGKGCSQCAGTHITRTETIRRIALLEERNIRLITPYKKVRETHRFLCLKTACGKEWNATFDNVYRAGRGCPFCAGRILTPEEKRRSEIRTIFNARLRSLFHDRAIKTKVYYDDKIMSIMEPYWLEEYTAFLETHPKPSDEQKWHLDHIIPCKWFDFEDLKQLQLCWNRRNLQWLPYLENLSKHCRIRPQDLTALTPWHYKVISQCSFPQLLPDTANLPSNQLLPASRRKAS